MLKILYAVFLIAHGLVHAGLAAAPVTNDPDPKPGAFFTASVRSWLLPRMGLGAPAVQWIGILLVALATLGFILAGLGVLGLPGLSAAWRTIAVVSACISLLLLVLFWHPWLIVGVLIDIVLLITLLWADWPTIDMIGS
jgi:hypothetical protein